MFEKVKALIADKLSINENEITMESAFIDDEAEKFVTVGDVVKFIKAHVEE